MSSSSSSSVAFFPEKSSGPLCSCAPPYCKSIARSAAATLYRRCGASDSSETYILISRNDLGNIARGELVKLLVVTKNDDRHIDGAEDGKLVSLLEQAALSL